jgi:hypothetical protein
MEKLVTINTNKIVRIKNLPGDLQAKALFNTFKQLRHSPSKNYSLKKVGNLTLSEAFVWKETEEGHDFWANIYYNDVVTSR